MKEREPMDLITIRLPLAMIQRLKAIALGESIRAMTASEKQRSVGYGLLIRRAIDLAYPADADAKRVIEPHDEGEMR